MRQVPISDDQRHERYRLAMQAALAAPRCGATKLLKGRDWRVGSHADEDDVIRVGGTAAIGSVDVCRDGAIY
jgi:hypothetical protein